MKIIGQESVGNAAGFTQMARSFSDEQRLVVGWTAGLVLAGTDLVLPTHFLCLRCCHSVDEEGAERSFEGRPVCPACRQPAHAHACLAPVQAGWTGWQAFSKNADPDFEVPFYYRTLAETIREAFTEEALLAEPEGAFGVLRDLLERRHFQNVIPLVGRLCLELYNEQEKPAVQQALSRLFGALCLAPQLSSIAAHARGRYREALLEFEKVSDVTGRIQNTLSCKQTALRVANQAKRAGWAGYRDRYQQVSDRFQTRLRLKPDGRVVALRKHYKILAALTDQQEHAWAEYRSKFEALSARYDKGMAQLMRRRKQYGKTLSHRLDAVATMAHAARLQRASRSLDFQAAFPGYKRSLYRAWDRGVGFYRRDLQHYIGNVLANCQHEPAHAVATLVALMDNTDQPTRHADDKLVQGWIEGGGKGASMVAARAAEHLGLGWVRYWVPAGDDVQDMSRLQIEKPQDKRWMRGDISRIEAEGGQEIFYDVKNTYVRAGRYSHLGVRHKHPGKTVGISYIGTLTTAGDYDVWRTDTDARQSPVPLFVSGIYNEHVVKVIKKFVADTTACVTVEPVDLWGSDIEGRDDTRVPAFLFVMPRAAWNPFGTTALQKRFLACLKDYVPKGILKVFGPDKSSGSERETTSFSARIEALLREAVVTARVPQLPFVYFTVLDALVAQFNDQIKGISSESVHVFVQETEQIFFGGGYKMPLGAWDPSESLSLVVQAFRMLLETLQGGQKTDTLPLLSRIEISKAGTIFARTAKGGRLTLVSHCDKKHPLGQMPLLSSAEKSEFCKSWPLVFGNDKGQIPNLPPAYSCGKCGRLLCNKGHGCPGAAPDDPACLWNIMRTGQAV